MITNETLTKDEITNDPKFKRQHEEIQRLLIEYLRNGVLGDNWHELFDASEFKGFCLSCSLPTHFLVNHLPTRSYNFMIMFVTKMLRMKEFDISKHPKMKAALKASSHQLLEAIFNELLGCVSSMFNQFN